MTSDLLSISASLVSRDQSLFPPSLFRRCAYREFESTGGECLRRSIHADAIVVLRQKKFLCEECYKGGKAVPSCSKSSSLMALPLPHPLRPRTACFDEFRPSSSFNQGEARNGSGQQPNLERPACAKGVKKKKTRRLATSRPPTAVASRSQVATKDSLGKRASLRQLVRIFP